VDHIKVDFATSASALHDPVLGQMGHGAFAARGLPAGTVITTSPLFHVPFDSFTYMNQYRYSPTFDETGVAIEGAFERHFLRRIGFQLLLNYCFHHPESTLLLCPYGVGVNYINHPPMPPPRRFENVGPRPNTTSRLDGALHPDANVHIRWAQNFSFVHNETMVEAGYIEELYFNYRPQLAFDYVATRNIRQGEPLYLDYGPIWEHAWQHHWVHWTATASSKNYVSAIEFNQKHSHLPVLTEPEQQSHPYPEHLQLRCHPKLLLNQSATEYIMESSPEYKWKRRDYGYLCRISARSKTSDKSPLASQRYSTTNEVIQQYLYTVLLGKPMDRKLYSHNSDRLDAVEEWIELKNIPRSAIRFFDKPGTSDLHLRNAFRFPIGIPEEMFPIKWRNRRSESVS
jgi:hypothetical protein